MWTPLVAGALAIAEHDGTLQATLTVTNNYDDQSVYWPRWIGIDDQPDDRYFEVAAHKQDLAHVPTSTACMMDKPHPSSFFEMRPRTTLRITLPVRSFAWHSDLTTYRIRFHALAYYLKMASNRPYSGQFLTSNEVVVRYRPSGEEWRHAGQIARKQGRPWPATEPKPVPAARKAALDRAEAAGAKKQPAVPPKSPPPAAKPPAKPAQPPPQPPRQGRVLTPEELRAEHLEEERARKRAAAAVAQHRVAAAKRPR